MCRLRRRWKTENTGGTISGTIVFAGGLDDLGIGGTPAVAAGTVLTGQGFFLPNVINDPPGTATEVVRSGGTAISTTINAMCRAAMKSSPNLLREPLCPTCRIAGLAGFP
jgi:hypothetical protein